MRKNEIVVVPGEDELAAALDGLTVVRESLAPLPGGDAAFIGNGPHGTISIGVERKRHDDLVRSWKDGSLADQLRRMLSNYDIVVLLQDGAVVYDPTTRETLYRSGGSYDALMNDLQTWQHEGVKYQISHLGDAGRRLWSLYHYFQKVEHRATRQGRVKRSSETPLLNVPGIGPKRAERLLEGLTKLPGASKIVEVVLGKGEVGMAFTKMVEEVQKGKRQ